MPSATLHIGDESHNFLQVTVHLRQHGDCNDFWDGNWVVSNIAIVAGGFRGEYQASLRTDDFERFRSALGELYQSLSGIAEFSGIEPWLTIRITSDDRGHFTAKCEAWDCLGTGNRLNFKLTFDQTQIPGMLKGLDEINAAFPVIGR